LATRDAMRNKEPFFNEKKTSEIETFGAIPFDLIKVNLKTLKECKCVHLINLT